MHLPLSAVRLIAPFYPASEARNLDNFLNLKNPRVWFPIEFEASCSYLRSHQCFASSMKSSSAEPPFPIWSLVSAKTLNCRLCSRRPLVPLHWTRSLQTSLHPFHLCLKMICRYYDFSHVLMSCLMSSAAIVPSAVHGINWHVQTMNAMAYVSVDNKYSTYTMSSFIPRSLCT